MTTLKTKFALSAAALALLATPALAQRPHHPQSYQHLQNYAPNANTMDQGTYPNGATRSGSAESVESGAEFNLSR
jgi:hypothetical protein